jgi:hypothetical protein
MFELICLDICLLAIYMSGLVHDLGSRLGLVS